MRTLEKTYTARLLSDTYEELEQACLPFIESYHADLTKHDKASITQNEGVPFLHWTRNYGTHITFLFHATHPTWPTQDYIKVPFIFGESDRRHILRENAGIAAYWAKDVNQEQIRAVHHFNGVKLRKITLEKAVEIANQWRDATNAAWNK